MTTALYRISSGEVTEISSADDTFDGFVNTPYWGILIDPPLSDGMDVRDSNHSYEVLGYAKINDNGTVRNATQQEIDTFATFRLDDYNKRDAAEAINYFKSDPKLRRIMIAFAAILIDEINILRSQHGLPDRTLVQLKTAIENRISKDD